MTAPNKLDFLSLPDQEKWKSIDRYITTLNQTMDTYHATYMAWLQREAGVLARDWPRKGANQEHMNWLSQGYQDWRLMDSALGGKGTQASSTRSSRPVIEPGAGGSVPPPPPPPPDWP